MLCALHGYTVMKSHALYIMLPFIDHSEKVLTVIRSHTESNRWTCDGGVSAYMVTGDDDDSYV
jgi:hypothetical protein